MVSEKSRANFNYLRIVLFLRRLRSNGLISSEEYQKAKTYYEKLTGAELLIVN